MATIKVTDIINKTYIFGCSIHRLQYSESFIFLLLNSFDIVLENLQNGISCSKFAYFSLIHYYSDSSFLDRFGLYLVQRLNFRC